MASSSIREGVGAKQQAFRLTPLFTVLLLAYPAMQARYALAEPTPANTPQPNTPQPNTPQPDTLPELGRPSDSPATLTPKSNGVTLDNRSDGKRLVVSTEYSDQTGLSLGGIFAFPLGDSAAGGLAVTAGNRKKELLFNAGFQMGDAQRLILTLGQQRQHLDIGFLSGTEKAALTQNNGAASYQFRMGRGLLDSAEINAYLADTPSRNLADKSYAVDTAALYELWNDPRRVAGGRVTGLQGRLVFTPLPGATFKLGAGGERQEYDYLTGKQSTTRATGSAEWVQCLAGGYQAKAGADAAAQNRYTLGLERRLKEGGMLGASFTGIRGKNGAPNDNRINLTWSYTFDSKGATPDKCGSAAQAWGSLLDQVAQRPGFLPAQVVAKLDTTAAPTRLIAVDKTALPAGASVNTVTGAISTPLGIVATGIAGVTLNAAPFANTGQFALSGNSLVIDPNQITQPAVGVTDTYVVTVNIFGGGTTLVTVVVSRGSVRIDSITIGAGAADITAPTTSAGPSVSGTTDTATTLSATINENGTGYYLVQAFAAAAPSVAAVQAGTSFAMAANVAATPAIGGLTASTAYKIYFVAKDAANNVQAAVQSVAVTTTATPDTTPPVTSSAPAISVAATDTAASVTQTINENGTGYYLVLPAADAIPTVAAVKAGTSFAMTANTPAAVSLTGLTPSTAYKYYFVAKDAANNDQAAVSAGLAVTTTATPDTTAPTTTAGPSVSGTTSTGTTLSATINENGTGYYLVQAFAAAAPSVAAVQAGTSFAMTANVAATPAISGLTAATAYKIYFVAKDAANNVQAAVQSVAVTTSATPDVTAPTTSAGPSVSGTTETGTTLSATINENGTGYYLVQAFAAAAPSVAAVQAGTSFAMTANVAATPAIGGLTASTAYKIYFVAKDAANNVQAAVQSVAVTAAADTTPPTTPATLTLTGNAGASAGYTNQTGLTLAVSAATEAAEEWFVAETANGVAAGVPPAGDAGWSTTQPTGFTLGGVNGARDITVYVKDAVGNVQSTGKIATITYDPVATTTLTWVGTTPDTKLNAYVGLQFSTDDSIVGGSITSITSSAGGAIANAAIIGGNIQFDWTTPNAGASNLRVQGKDIAGNLFDITKVVNLPN